VAAEEATVPVRAAVGGVAQHWGAPVLQVHADLVGPMTDEGKRGKEGDACGRKIW
jgi:hypothetical protein